MHIHHLFTAWLNQNVTFHLLFPAPDMDRLLRHPLVGILPVCSDPQTA